MCCITATLAYFWVSQETCILITQSFFRIATVIPDPFTVDDRLSQTRSWFQHEDVHEDVMTLERQGVVDSIKCAVPSFSMEYKVSLKSM